MRNVLVLACLAGLAANAALADSEADSLFDPTEGVPGIFEVQPDGQVKHVQSGLVCPTKYPNADIYHLLVYAQDGHDVGCDYRRADPQGGAWMKLTIFATKAASGATTADAFAGYREEVLQTYPDAQSHGDAIDADTKNDGPFENVRSEEFIIAMNGQPYTTQLLVSVCKGWMIEVRTSFVGLPDAIDAAREGPDSAKLEMGDRVVGVQATLQAISTVCG